MGYGLEVELVAAARAQDLLTTPYVFSADDARAMTEAGADIIVLPHGPDHRRLHRRARPRSRWTTASALIDEWAAAARERPRRRPRALPRRPDRDARRRRLRPVAHAALPRLLRRHIMERLPTEQALTATTRAFKSTRL